MPVEEQPVDRNRKDAARTPSGRRGRPRKFRQPSRAVTLTLPEDVIDVLRSIDTDLSRAVASAVMRLSEAPRLPAEIASYGPDRSVIVVPHSRTLESWTGAELLPLRDGRALLAFGGGLTVPEFELRLSDALADPALDDEDRTVFDAIARILRVARREERAAVQQRSIIVLRD